MKCRSLELREQMVKIYDITPIAHIKLLDNQMKVSCTGDQLIDKYYCFAYKFKKDLEFNKSFICGSHASKHFLSLIGHEPLEVFNPLKTDGTGSGGTSGSGTMNKKWDGLSKELYNAINILLVYWDKPPSGPILDIRLKLEKYYYKKPFDSTVKSVNTIIKKGANGLKLYEVVQELSENNDIKEYSFMNIEQKLNELNVESFIY